MVNDQIFFLEILSNLTAPEIIAKTLGNGHFGTIINHHKDLNKNKWKVKVKFNKDTQN